MKNPPTLDQNRAQQAPGFDLVVTLSLMILLTVIAVGLLSLSAKERGFKPVVIRTDDKSFKPGGVYFYTRFVTSATATSSGCRRANRTGGQWPPSYTTIRLTRLKRRIWRRIRRGLKR